MQVKRAMPIICALPDKTIANDIFSEQQISPMIIVTNEL